MRDFTTIEEVIAGLKLFSEKSLDELERRLSSRDAKDVMTQECLRLLAEYRQCRVLLRTALDQKARILNWPSNEQV